MANNKIQVKRTTVSGRQPNTTGSYSTNSQYIAAGEFALNMTDGILYSSNGTSAIPIGANNVNLNVSNTITAYALKAGGSLGTVGQVLISNGSAVSWSDIQPTESIYVAISGDDTNGNGSVTRPYRTIKKACSVATADTIISIQPGTYYENNPITIPAYVNLVGALRGVTIIPNNTTSDLFYLNNGVYVTDLTVKDYVSPAAAFSFPPDGSAGAITRSPYVFNCTSITTTGIGLLIDGSKASGNKSIIAGLYTIINSGGIGVKIINRGYSQLVNIYTICADIGVQCDSGGFCTLNCSDNSFGNYGLVANGTSSALYSGVTYGNNQFGTQFVISGLDRTPYINNTVKFTGDANYYTVVGVTPLAANTSTVTLMERINTTVANNTSVTFYQRSQISAAGHAFEYVGSGTNLSTAIPFNGGVSNTAKQTLSTNGGTVNYTSTDQFGNFNINSNLTINGQTATIEGDAFQRSLFGLMTPYILSLEGTL